MDKFSEFKNSFGKSKPHQAFRDFPRKSAKGSSAVNFTELLAKTALKLGVGTEVEAARLCFLARQELEIHLPAFAHLAKVKSFKKGVLSITAATPATLARVNAKKHLIQISINQKSGLSQVKKILLKPDQSEQILDYLDNTPS
jgi:hypothetical protein